MSSSLPDEALRDFLVESGEGLDQVEREFIALEADPTARDRLAVVFRAVHTVKGTSGFFGFSKLESLAHAGESLLSRLRDGTLLLSPDITSALLVLTDRIRRVLRCIEVTGSEGPDRHDDLTARLAALAHPPASAPEADPALDVEPELDAASAPEMPPPGVGPPPGSPPPPVAPPPAMPSEGRPEAGAEGAIARKSAMAPAVSDSNIRVDVGLLDKLMNLVGELVLARNQIVQSAARFEEPTFATATQRLNLITTELQEGVMKTRMQPIGNLWNRLPRVVRDLATSCGKQIRIEMSGKETELDRTILEAIKDPITHAVRNAIDHGIEAPAVRASRGKPRTGTLSLRAYHEGGQVNIEISDDGAGMDPDAIRHKSVELGLVSPERAARMTDRELTQLVFLPGFTTAPAVTSLSGRGVGMDVIKIHVEKIGGVVDLVSAVGAGTTLRIKIPLTLAIVPALIVTSAGERYAIPQVSLVELVRLEGALARQRVETIDDTPIYRLRGRLLPLVHLDRALELDPRRRPRADDDEVVSIVVLKAGDQEFGLVVDEIHDNEEIVVKPLHKGLKAIASFAGATIMGDGRVALIIDVMGMAQRAGVSSETPEDAIGGRDDSSAEARAEAPSLLLFDAGRGDLMAIPLAMVARLEEFPAARVERSGGREFVQYRGEVMPLLHLSALMSGAAPEPSDSIQVVVYSSEGRTIGIVVDRIIDIVEQQRAADGAATSRDFSTAVVVQGKVTQLLDLHGLIRAHDPGSAGGGAHVG